MGMMTSHIWNEQIKNVWNHQPEYVDSGKNEMTIGTK